MFVHELKKVLIKDLQKLREEISLYRSEANLWRVEKDIANSAGNLCLHLVGNLNTYFGAVMGNTSYVRNRDAEFALKNVPQKDLLKMVDNAIPMIDKVLSSMTDAEMEKEYPMLVLKEKTSTGYFFIHLASHLGYHLGQINYHRRLVGG